METMKNKIDDQKLKKELFRNVMKGQWEDVKRICTENPTALMLQITRAGHTALHVAVSEAKEDVVKYMVRITTITNSSNIGSSKPELVKALGVGDERGHTALHFAAAMGNVSICECIAAADVSLIGAHNGKGETPLFWAVMYGQRDAFFSLNSKCNSHQDGLSYSRRSDGQTILHCAIFGEDFGSNTPS